VSWAWTSSQVGSQLSGVSCPTEAFCAIVDHYETIYGGDPRTQSPAIWTAATKPPGLASSLSCPSASFCAVGDSMNDVETSTSPLGGPSAWQATQVFPTSASGTPPYVRGVACRSTGLCVAAGESSNGSMFPVPAAPAYIATSTDPANSAPAWSVDTFPAGGDLIGGVACANTALCVAGGDGTLLVSSDPTGGAAAWVNIAGGPYATSTLGTGSFDHVSCGRPDLCAAIDSAGNLYISADPTAGAASWHVASISQHPLSGISCPSALFCAAVDSTGTVFTSTDPSGPASNWTATNSGASSGGEIACGGPSACVILPTANSSQVLVGQAVPVSPKVHRPTTAAIARLLRGELKRAGKAARIGALVRHPTFTISAQALTAGRMTVHWYEDTKGRRAVQIAAGSVRFAKAGIRRLIVRLTAPGRRRLRQVDRLPLSLRGSFAASGRPTVTASASTVLTR
jgi:hypothetical protein